MRTILLLALIALASAASVPAADDAKPDGGKAEAVKPGAVKPGPDEVAALHERVAELERRVAELTRDAVTWKALNDAQLTIYGAFDTPGTALAPGLVTLFGLTGDERAAVDGARSKAHERMVALLAEQKPAPVVAGGTMTLAIHDFSAGGAKVKAELSKQLKQALGAERARFLEKVDSASAEQRFLAFGEGELTLSLTRQPDGQLQSSLERKHGGGSSSTMGTYPELPDSLALFVPFVPKAFGGTAGEPAADADQGKPRGEKRDF